MNIFHKYTRESLRKNRTRTLVTVIGILLSMSLFTAVIEGAYSGICFLRNAEIEVEGAWQGVFCNLDEEGLERAKAAPELESIAYERQVGWADIKSHNDEKPYLLIKSAGENLTDLLHVRLTSGRMPESETEILLPNHLADNGGVYYQLGDTLELSVGKRVSDGCELTQDTPFIADEEMLTDCRERTYTVVGFYERLSWSLESYYCPGYTAYTKGEADGSYYAYFTLRNPASFYKFIDRQRITEDWSAHTELLRYYGADRNSNYTSYIYGLAAILVLLIAFGSISLIYNSFSISVSERTKQFGILKSVGATKAQIRKTVLYEALVLGVGGILAGMVVGCVGIGVTLRCLQGAFSSLMGPEYSTKICLVIHPLALLAAAAVCLVTTLLSAWIPAKRAMRIPAMEAIRQADEIKIRPREVRTCKLTQKLFGFSGMMAAKNFKRNRKRYRSTVLSLFMSITLFVSASSFCSYLMDSIEGFSSADTDSDISYYVLEADEEKADMVLELLSGVEGVSRGMYYENAADNVWFAGEDISAKYRDYLKNDLQREEEKLTGQLSIYSLIVFLEDSEFVKLCEENGWDAQEYFDTNAPKGLLYNDRIAYCITGENSGKRVHFEALEEKKLPITGYYKTIREIDGYSLQYTEEKEDGSVEYFYYPQEYLSEYWEKESSAKELDESKALRLSADEAEQIVALTVDRILKDGVWGLPADNMMLVYPFSMRLFLLGDRFQTSYQFAAEKHAQVYEEMKSLLAQNDMDTFRLYDIAEMKEKQRTLVMVVNVFSYGFIILISLIAVANVFNTISTNVSLRRREFAMLKSIGLPEKDFRRMMRYECFIYGAKGLLWGLPASILMTYVIYRVTGVAYEMSFYIPWYSVVIAVGSVFAVVFATMLYATDKIRKDNLIDALKNENL